MTFDKALPLLKEGACITRKGWSGQGQWLEIQENPIVKPGCGNFAGKEGWNWRYKCTLPFIVVYMTSGHVLPWSISQKDVLFDDWEVVVDNCGQRKRWKVSRNDDEQRHS